MAYNQSYADALRKRLNPTTTYGATDTGFTKPSSASTNMDQGFAKTGSWSNNTDPGFAKIQSQPAQAQPAQAPQSYTQPKYQTPDQWQSLINATRQNLQPVLNTQLEGAQATYGQLMPQLQSAWASRGLLASGGAAAKEQEALNSLVSQLQSIRAQNEANAVSQAGTFAGLGLQEAGQLMSNDQANAQLAAQIQQAKAQQDLAQQQADWQKTVDTASLTGQLNGQQTLPAIQTLADITGYYNGNPTLARYLGTGNLSNQAIQNQLTGSQIFGTNGNTMTEPMQSVTGLSQPGTYATDFFNGIGGSATWDPNAGATTFSYGGKTWSWRPGESSPLPGLTAQNGRFVVTNPTALANALAGNGSSGSSSSSGSTTRSRTSSGTTTTKASVANNMRNLAQGISKRLARA